MAPTLSNTLKPTSDASLLNQPIGVFDSGVGGLSVVREIQKRLPGQKVLYLADNKNVPYGGRTDDEIRKFTADAVSFLFKKGCKAVVIACNTASAYSLTHLRQTYGPHFPVIGLVPAVKPACLHSKTGVVGVLATPGTLRGGLLQDVIAQHATPRNIEVLTAVSPQLVPLVEKGLHESLECEVELKEIITPLIEQNIDHLVLGCTHYPFLKPALQRLFPSLSFVDSGEAVARHTAQTLYHHRLLPPADTIACSAGQLECYATKYDIALENMLKLFAGQTISLKFLLK